MDPDPESTIDAPPPVQPGGIDPTVTAEPAALPAVAARSMARGTTIGRFLVLDERGAGGMGRVYAAYDPELDRKVAIKLVRPDRDPAGLEAASLRLLREAQTMAKISHPNVVAVYDVGAFDDQVFLAMELIDGPDLAGWLAAARRPWREVVERFAMAGHGLAAAHAVGLVHRDFKPANVIVCDRVVKVGDFGLARSAADADVTASPPAASPAIAATSALTEPGAVVGTPRYMAPEQREGRSGPLADQYSFCRAVADALDGVDGSPPRTLRRAIERGLADDPARRWPSMDELLAAIARACRGRARLAWAIAAAGGIGAVAVAVALGAVGSPPTCAAGSAGLAGVWDPPARAAARAAFERIGAGPTFAAIAAALDDYAARWASAHHDTCVATRVRREQSPALMDLRYACLAARREELRTLVGQLATADAAAVPALARAAHGLSPLAPCADAAELSAPVAPPADPGATQAIAAARAALASGRVIGQLGRYDDALPPVTAALEQARARGWRPLIAEAALEAGMLSVQAGKLDDGERLLLDAAWFAEASRHDRVAAEAWTVLVFAAVQRGTELERADAWAGRADAAIERIGGDRDLRARLYNHLGAVAYLRGDYPAARAQWERALAEAKAFLPVDHPDVARVENNLGIVADTVGDAAVAEAHYQRAIAAWQRALGDRHPLVAAALTNVGSLRRGRGDLAGAIADYRRAIAIYEAANGPDHPILADPLLNLGNALLPSGDVAGAVAAYERALALRTAAFGATSPQVAQVLASLGAAHRQAGELARSIEVLERALAIQREALGADHVTTAITLTALGETLMSRGEPAAARPRFEQALAAFERAHGRRHAMTAYALTGLARTRLAGGDAAAAVVLLEDALAAREAAGDPGPLAETRFVLARALWAGGGDRDRARRLVEQARPQLTGPRLDPDLDPAGWDRETAGGAP